MVTLYYFAYGSNIDQNQMISRCPYSMKMYKGVLKDYKLISAHHSRTWGGGVFSVKESPGSNVEGIIYEVTVEDMDSLDRYEGFPISYRREDVLIDIIDEDKKMECFIYISNSKEVVDISEDYLYHCQEAAIKENIKINY